MSQHKILVLSDLHMDQWEARTESHAIKRVLSFVPDEFRKPALIISAGDLAHTRPFGWDFGIREIKESFPKKTPLILIPGNHDYYHGELDDEPLRMATLRYNSIFGQKHETHVGATRILTCTLWSDMLLFGDENVIETARIVQRSLNDYAVIKKPGTYIPISVEDTVRIHEDHVAWLRERLETYHDGPTMVVSHHGPHPEASLPVDQISAGFVSDLTYLIEEHQPDMWVFGHTHRPQTAKLGKTIIHNVGVGYPHEVGIGPEHLTRSLRRGCIEVGDEIRLTMDDEDMRNIRIVNREHEEEIRPYDNI